MNELLLNLAHESLRRRLRMAERIGLALLYLLLCLLLTGCTPSFGTRPKAAGAAVFRDAGNPPFAVEVVATDLEVPWSLAWLPDGTLLVAERPGRLVSIDIPSHTVRPVANVPGVDAHGEHGLMGMALSPAFASDHTLYLSYTGRDKNHALVNRIAKYTLIDHTLTEVQVLVDNLPAGDYHDGLPLHFGPDGKLYASTGDATKGYLAQQMDSLAGKFLRMNADGSAPADNPFRGSLIWTLGNRNGQGFDWHPVSRLLYESEHGPSGFDGPGGGDEVNLIEKGGNYGWPIYHHDKSQPPFIAPLMTWTPAIAPSGACFYTGKGFPQWKDCFFMAALRGEALWRLKFSAEEPRKVLEAQPLLHEQYGRLRCVAMGPDGYLYFTTSNRDARGKPAPGDDKILRIVPVK